MIILLEITKLFRDIMIQIITMHEKGVKDNPFIKIQKYRLRMTRIHEQMYLEFNQQNKIQHKFR